MGHNNQIRNLSNILCDTIFRHTAINIIYNSPRQKAAAASAMPIRLKYALHSYFQNSLTIRNITLFKEIIPTFPPSLFAISTLSCCDMYHIRVR